MALEQLYQLVVEENATGKQIIASPAAGEEFVRRFAALVSRMIAAGREKQWSNPTVVPVYSISTH
jgi:hypothetical protein